jgi:hypothetical protein
MKSKRKKTVLGSLDVDSGQLLIVDPAYLEAWEDGKHYSACCKQTTKKFGGEVRIHGPAQGVAVKAGPGDGSYPVIATIEDGRIISIRIDFYEKIAESETPDEGGEEG